MKFWKRELIQILGKEVERAMVLMLYTFLNCKIWSNFSHNYLRYTPEKRNKEGYKKKWGYVKLCFLCTELFLILLRFNQLTSNLFSVWKRVRRTLNKLDLANLYPNVNWSFSKDIFYMCTSLQVNEKTLHYQIWRQT